jgi:hypothetical protein
VTDSSKYISLKRFRIDNNSKSFIIQAPVVTAQRVILFSQLFLTFSKHSIEIKRGPHLFLFPTELDGATTKETLTSFKILLKIFGEKLVPRIRKRRRVHSILSDFLQSRPARFLAVISGHILKYNLDKSINNVVNIHLALFAVELLPFL